MRFDIGSARKTPSTPYPNLGNKIVSGTTIITFLNNEKKMACFAYPNAWKVDCPQNWKAMKQNPKKYIFKAFGPFESTVASLVKIFIS